MLRHLVRPARRVRPLRSPTLNALNLYQLECWCRGGGVLGGPAAESIREGRCEMVCIRGAGGTQRGPVRVGAVSGRSDELRAEVVTVVDRGGHDLLRAVIGAEVDDLVAGVAQRPAESRLRHHDPHGGQRSERVSHPSRRSRFTSKYGEALRAPGDVIHNFVTTDFGGRDLSVTVHRRRTPR